MDYVATLRTLLCCLNVLGICYFDQNRGCLHFLWFNPDCSLGCGDCSKIIQVFLMLESNTGSIFMSFALAQTGQQIFDYLNISQNKAFKGWCLVRRISCPNRASTRKFSQGSSVVNREIQAHNFQWNKFLFRIVSKLKTGVVSRSIVCEVNRTAFSFINIISV